jgi:hypothetical protein
MDNYLFDLKVKELKALNKKFEIIDDILVLLEDQPVVIGCKECYLVKPEQTQSGYKIPTGYLINFYEKYKGSCGSPPEVLMNCWLCPKCGRLFKELLPSFEFVSLKNVSI